MGDAAPLLRLGVIGLGRAFASMAPSLLAHPTVRLVAACDLDARALAHCARDFGAHCYTDADALLADPQVDAVYIATPHELHVPQTLQAFAQRKHVLLEKPMAMTLDDARRLVDAAEAAGCVLVVGHSHGFDRPFVEAARLIASGRFGAVRMVTALNYTNWVYRPRRPEEIAPGSAGVVLNQASHQVDIVRLVTGGLVASVRAGTGAWDPARPTIGAYAALLQLESGAFASLGYSGYDHFDSDELNGWTSELGRAKPADGHGSARRRLRDAPAGGSEAQSKAGVGYAGMIATPRPDIVDLQTQWHQQFGLVIVGCEGADLRINGRGVTIYDADGVRALAVPPPVSGGARSPVFDELRDAALLGRPPLHSGRWALANLEVCLAMLDSGRSRREVALQHQVPPMLDVHSGLVD